MRGSTIVFATEATGVSALLERAGGGCGRMGVTFGAGGCAQAASRRTTTARRRVMVGGLCKNSSQPLHAFPNALVRLLRERQAHGVLSAAVHKKWRAWNVRDSF